jgi:hypothetical protein
MSEIVKKYNGLAGAILNREQIEQIISEASSQEQAHVVHKLQRLLDTYDDAEFTFDSVQPACETVPASLLEGLDLEQDTEKGNGLAKAVSPNDVYQMITDRMLEMLKTASGRPVKAELSVTAIQYRSTLPQKRDTEALIYFCSQAFSQSQIHSF